MEKKCINCGKELSYPVVDGYCNAECYAKVVEKDNLETIFTDEKEIYKTKKTLFYIFLLALSVLGIILSIIL